MGKYDRLYLVSGHIIEFVLSMAALKSGSVAGFILLVSAYIVVTLVFARTCRPIRESGRPNQIMFVGNFFTGVGFFIKGFRVVFNVMSGENMLVRLAYSISAYVFVFVVMAMVILYVGCLIFKKQRCIK